MSASLALQGAIVAALKADNAVKAIVGTRVFDVVTALALMPYISLGEDQVLPDGSECFDGYEIRSTLHLWSRAVGFPEVKRLAAAVDDALGDELVVPGHHVIACGVTDTRFLRDPDGLTSRAVLSLQTLIETAG